MEFAREDRLQKTWIPEGTEEYREFKHITQENAFLAEFIRKRFAIGPDDLVLDVGGREGDISIAVQRPESIDLIDPDPTLELAFRPARYERVKIQEAALHQKYALIICSHVLGYLGLQAVQSTVLDKLIAALKPGGTLVLFYNTNSGYMGQLLKFSRSAELDGHYDYFDEGLLEKHRRDIEVSRHDVTFNLEYPSFEALARACWFLFGAMDQDISKVAGTFLPKLQADLTEPSFPIEERILLIRRRV